MAADTKVVKNRKPPRAGMGRPKGSLNKTTGLLKDAVLEAAAMAGNPLDENDPDGLKLYLKARAIDTPGPYLTLMGKVLPLTVAGDPNAPITHLISWLDPTDR